MRGATLAFLLLSGCGEGEIEEGCAVWWECCTRVCGTEAEEAAYFAQEDVPQCDCDRQPPERRDCVVTDDTCAFTLVSDMR